MSETIDPTTAADAIRSYLDRWRTQNMGKTVRTPAGKFVGRPGIVDGAFYDIEGTWERPHGLCVLVMTLGRDGNVLNTHGDSRAYWPISSIPELTA